MSFKKLIFLKLLFYFIFYSNTYPTDFNHLSLFASSSKNTFYFKLFFYLKPQASGWCVGRPFPFRRSGAIAPGILRRPRPLKIPFVRFLSDDVSLLSKPRASMARSVLCPVHFLFFVLRAGGHNGVQLGILREAVNKRDGGIPEEQQPFAGIGMGHIGKLVGADPKLFG